MAKTLQYLKYARKMNEYLKSGYFGIDGHLQIFTEMVSIFFSFFGETTFTCFTCMLMIWIK